MTFKFFMEFDGITIEQCEQNIFIYKIEEKIFDITKLETWGWGTNSRYSKNRGLHEDVLKEAISHKTI